MKEFNERNCAGSITVLPCDNFRQRPETKEGTPLLKVLDIESNHPLINFFTSIVFNENTDVVPDEMDILDGDTNNNLATEKLLQEYYSTDQQLLELEKTKYPIAKIESNFQIQLRITLEKLSAFSGLMSATTNMFHKLIEVQNELPVINQIKVDLNRILWRQKLNAQLITLVSSGQLEEKGVDHFNSQLTAWMNTESEISHNRISYDPSKADDQIRFLKFLMENHFDTIYWPAAVNLVTRNFNYINMDMPYEEQYPELKEELQDQLSDLKIGRRIFIRLQMAKDNYKTTLPLIEYSTSRQLKDHEHADKTLTQLECELKRLEREANVYPHSKTMTKKATNYVKKLQKKKLETGDQNNAKDVEKGLKDYLAYDESTMKHKVILELWQHVKMFYEYVRPGEVDNVEIIFKTHENRTPGKYLSFTDLAGVEIVFRTRSGGNFGLTDVGHEAVKIFSIAVLFAKMKANSIKVVALSAITTIDAHVLEKIVQLFLDHQFQVITQSEEATAKDTLTRSGTFSFNNNM